MYGASSASYIDALVRAARCHKCEKVQNEANKYFRINNTFRKCTELCHFAAPINAASYWHGHRPWISAAARADLNTRTKKVQNEANKCLRINKTYENCSASRNFE